MDGMPSVFSEHPRHCIAAPLKESQSLTANDSALRRMQDRRRMHPPTRQNIVGKGLPHVHIDRQENRRETYDCG